MEKELVMACLLLTLCTMLKIWSIVTLCQISFALETAEENNSANRLLIKGDSQKTNTVL